MVVFKSWLIHSISWTSLDFWWVFNVSQCSFDVDRELIYHRTTIDNFWLKIDWGLFYIFINSANSTLYIIQITSSDHVSHSRTSPLRPLSSLKLNSTGSLQISSRLFLKVPWEPHRAESYAAGFNWPPRRLLHPKDQALTWQSVVV